MAIASYRPLQNFVAVQWDGSDEALRQIRVIVHPYKASRYLNTVQIENGKARKQVLPGEFLGVLYDMFFVSTAKDFEERFELIEAKNFVQAAKQMEVSQGLWPHSKATVSPPAPAMPVSPRTLYSLAPEMTGRTSSRPPTPILVYRRGDYPEHINTIEWRGDNESDVRAFLFERFGNEVQITKADDGLFLERQDESDEESGMQHYVAKGWRVAECDGVLAVFDAEQIKKLELLEGFAS
jgi:hypothetical protein